MDMVKLINKKGDIIERTKLQYEPNVDIWSLRDQTIIEEKPKVTKTTTKKAE